MMLAGYMGLIYFQNSLSHLRRRFAVFDFAVHWAREARLPYLRHWVGHLVLMDTGGDRTIVCWALNPVYGSYITSV